MFIILQPTKCTDKNTYVLLVRHWATFLSLILVILLNKKNYIHFIAEEIESVRLKFIRRHTASDGRARIQTYDCMVPQPMLFILSYATTSDSNFPVYLFTFVYTERILKLYMYIFSYLKD